MPYQVSQWRSAHPDERIGDGQIFAQPWVMGPKTDPRKRMIFYQYRADRARRTLKGIDQQIAKAEKAVAGQAAVKRNRFVQLSGATKSINRQLEAKARALAGLKGYVTNLEARPLIRDGRLPPALADREELPDVQVRPSRSADLPPQTRLDRSSPYDRVHRARGQQMARVRDRMEHQQAREDPAPISQHRHPDRRPHPPRTPLDNAARAAPAAVRPQPLDTNLSQVGTTAICSG